MRTSGTALESLKPALRARVEAALARQAGGRKPSQLGADAPARGAAPPDRPDAVFPFTIWLPYRVPSLNALLGRGRWVRREAKAAAKAALASALAGAPFPRQGGARVHVSVTCFVLQVRDADNPCPKFLIDQLRYAGILRDDHRGCMALTVNPDVRVRSRKLEGTRLTLVEAP